MQATVNNSNYPDIKTRGSLPNKATGTKGVLLLHGFTSHTDCVSGLLPFLEAEKIDYEMPWLRGHGTVPEDLKGVRASDWYDDAFEALKKLSQRVDSIVIVGLSMGGLVALNLCAAQHEVSPKITACVTWAAALSFKNPFSALVKPLSFLFKMWPGQESFNDPECRKKCNNYPKFPTKTFGELYDFAAKTRKRIQDVHVPLCTIQSRKDQVIPYQMSEFLFEHSGASYCERIALDHSGHELGQDCEANVVFEQTMRFLHEIW